MTQPRHDIVIVTPIYEDRDASSRLFHELARELGPRAFVIAVDDGSVRQPVTPDSLRNAGLDGAVLRLRRNVGHQRAIAIGLGHASETLRPGQTVVVMDSDGEDLPSTLRPLLAPLDDQAVDVVVAQRRSRVETLQFKLFYQIYKRVFRLLTGRPISFGNFMALKPAAVRRLVAMQELPIHVAAAVLASKLRTAGCPLDRGPRYAGQSKMNFVGLALHGFKALMVFAEDVLVRVGIFSALVAALAITGTALAVALKLFGFSTPGWFSIALGVLLLIFLQTGALALTTLMLSGVMRSGSVVTAVAHREFIAEVIETSA